ncbi:MAG: hypothetical protein A2Y12_02355 [Planctomycetes bacterium GWF2_42_9]|nr:MAG: hypothetical protein A2Y12_02355 [Planctomycetes bacterium GWF2_42_9]
MTNLPLTNKNKIILGCSVVILLLILAFLFQGRRGLWQPDEGYYVGTAMTMLNKHSMLVPYLGEDEIFLDKPPVIYWAMISAVKLIGHNEFAVRFFHGLSYLVTCLTVGLLASSIFGNRRMLVLGAIVYGTMIAPFIAANIITPDTPLALFTAICALAFWKSITAGKPSASLWKMILFCALGLGFLTKGPAVFIPFAGMIGFLAITRQLKAFIFDRWIVVSIILFICIGLGWYIWVGAHLAGGFSYFWDNQVWGRLVSSKYKRNPGLIGSYIYLMILIAGTLPWCILWLQKPASSTLTRYIKKEFWLSLVSNHQKLFLVSWFLIPLFILCMASSKLPLYALPLLAPVAIACAKLWSDRLDMLILNSSTKPVLLSSIRFVLIWCLFLVLIKYVVAIYPTERDSRALWQEISKHVPQSDYEICTINRRADGLIFYATPAIIEHLTLKKDPYPTYMKTENLFEEISGNLKEGENETMLILASKPETADTVCSMMSQAGIEFTKVKLAWQKWLIILTPEKYSKMKQLQASSKATN